MAETELKSRPNAGYSRILFEKPFDIPRIRRGAAGDDENGTKGETRRTNKILLGK